MFYVCRIRCARHLRLRLRLRLCLDASSITLNRILKPTITKHCESCVCWPSLSLRRPCEVIPTTHIGLRSLLDVAFWLSTTAMCICYLLKSCGFAATSPRRGFATTGPRLRRHKAAAHLAQARTLRAHPAQARALRAHPAQARALRAHPPQRRGNSHYLVQLIVPARDARSRL